MFALIWMLSIRVRSFLRRFMPTNILLGSIFTRRGLKWGMLTVLLAALYLFGAVVCAGLDKAGAPGWINLLVVLFLWNGAKFAFAGPMSLAWLILVRIREGRARRMVRAPLKNERMAGERMNQSSARFLH